jgi:hypothetical protein
MLDVLGSNPGGPLLFFQQSFIPGKNLMMEVHGSNPVKPQFSSSRVRYQDKSDARGPWIEPWRTPSFLPAWFDPRKNLMQEVHGSNPGGPLVFVHQSSISGQNLTQEVLGSNPGGPSFLPGGPWIEPWQTLSFLPAGFDLRTNSDTRGPWIEPWRTPFFQQGSIPGKV